MWMWIVVLPICLIVTAHRSPYAVRASPSFPPLPPLPPPLPSWRPAPRPFLLRSPSAPGVCSVVRRPPPVGWFPVSAPPPPLGHGPVCFPHALLRCSCQRIGTNHQSFRGTVPSFPVYPNSVLLAMVHSTRAQIESAHHIAYCSHLHDTSELT